MGLGAAVIGGAAISGLGSLASGFMQSSAAKQASQQQYQASMAALAQQKQMFGTAQGALNPYISAGANGLPSLSGLLTPGTAASTLSSLPGFQFQSQWGTLAAQNALAAQGLGGSTGPLAKAISDYNTGLAGTYYNNYVNQLQQFGNMGMGAASALAGNAINAGNAMAQTQQSAGNALASGTLGSANALASGFSGATGSVGNSLLMSSLLNQNSANSGLYSPFSNNLNLAANAGTPGWSLASF